jgi:hypothetical protein
MRVFLSICILLFISVLVCAAPPGTPVPTPTTRPPVVPPTIPTPAVLPSVPRIPRGPTPNTQPRTSDGRFTKGQTDAPEGNRPVDMYTNKPLTNEQIRQGEAIYKERSDATFWSGIKESAKVKHDAAKAIRAKEAADQEWRDRITRQSNAAAAEQYRQRNERIGGSGGWSHGASADLDEAMALDEYDTVPSATIAPRKSKSIDVPVQKFHQRRRANAARRVGVSVQVNVN